MITLTKTEAQDIIWGESNYKVLETKITNTGRWSIHKRIIFKKDEKFYQLEYSEGATEYQDEQPFQYDDFVDCKEVEPISVIDYRVIKTEDSRKTKTVAAVPCQT